jgi:Exportin-T
LETRCGILSSSVAAITNLSKGFTKPSDEVAAILKETLHITQTVLQIVPSNNQIRNKSMVHVQRMIECVGQNVLDLLPTFLNILVHWSTCDDILFVAQIFNLLCIKFKKSAVSTIDAALLPFLHKCQSLIPPMDDVVPETGTAVPPPHLQTEQLAIRKLSYVVLQHIVTHQVTEVLLSITNVAHLETVLRLMNDGIVTVEDPNVKKTCLRFFRALTEQVKIQPASSGTSEASRPIHIYGNGILVFVGEIVLPNTLKVMMTNQSRQKFISDPNAVRVVTEFSQLMCTFRITCDVDRERHILFQKMIDALGQCCNTPDNSFLRLHQQLQESNTSNEVSMSIQNAIRESIRK